MTIGIQRLPAASVRLVPFLDGAESFAVAIIGRLGLLNVLRLIGLVAVCEIARFPNPARGSRRAP
jgi:hypothetical protein